MARYCGIVSSKIKSFVVNMFCMDNSMVLLKVLVSFYCNLLLSHSKCTRSSCVHESETPSEVRIPQLRGETSELEFANEAAQVVEGLPAVFLVQTRSHC